MKKEKKYIVDNPDLLEEWNWDKNNLLEVFPNTTALRANRKVWWKCKKGHEWEMSPDNKLRGKGCPYCLNKRVLVGFNDLCTLSPQLSKEWDFDANERGRYAMKY